MSLLHALANLFGHHDQQQPQQHSQVPFLVQQANPTQPGTIAQRMGANPVLQQHPHANPSPHQVPSNLQHLIRLAQQPMSHPNPVVQRKPVQRMQVPLDNLNGTYNNIPLGGSVVSDLNTETNREEYPRFYPHGLANSETENEKTYGGYGTYPLLPINPAGLEHQLPYLSYKN